MRVSLNCIPCFLNQTLEATKFATNDLSLQQIVIRKILKKLAVIPWDTTPVHIGHAVHSIVKTICKNNDPYKNIKRKSNEIAKRLCTLLEKRVSTSKDRLETSLKISLAGNVIDFGAKADKNFTLDYNIINLDEVSIDKVDILDFKEKITQAHKILFLGDNAGEVALDKFLLEEIGTHKIVYTVKSHPIINDATLEDAEECGLTEMVKVITNGTDYPGTPLDICSKFFLKEFHEADLIISKGQGNYETLSTTTKPIFFLLKVKCPVIAEDIKEKVGSFVIKGKNLN